jgi:hypothetical protein
LLPIAEFGFFAAVIGRIHQVFAKFNQVSFKFTIFAAAIKEGGELLATALIMLSSFALLLKDQADPIANIVAVISHLRQYRNSFADGLPSLGLRAKLAFLVRLPI